MRAARAALLDEQAAALLTLVRGVFCEPTRAQIVRALVPGPLCVTDLARVIARSKTVASRHLRVLRDEGFVERHRRGRRVFYALALERPAVGCAVQALDTVARLAA